MFAVIRLSGNQYLVKEKDVLKTEKLELEPGKTKVVNEVLLIHDGKTTKVGKPYIDGSSVTLTTTKNGLGKKVRVFKMKAKKRYKRTYGHRQPYTEVEVTKISA